MKFEYKFKNGDNVLLGNEVFTVNRRYGGYEFPAYYLYGIDRIVSEDELKVISSNGTPSPFSKKITKNQYEDYLSTIDNRCPTLSKYSRNLNLFALNNKLIPTYGRKGEVNQIRKILLRRTKPNALLLGQSGCGKTAIIEELARTFVHIALETNDDTTPIIYELSFNALIGGTRYRGDFEERLQNIIKELENKDNIVIFIDEIHQINEIGSAEGCTGMGQLLKPALARGDIKCIGATTIEEYNKYIATDKALARRFSNVNVKQLTGKIKTACIENILTEYGAYFNIDITEIEVNEVENIVTYCLPNTVFPNNIIDVVDEVLATAKFEKRDKITMTDIKNTISEISELLVI